MLALVLYHGFIFPCYKIHFCDPIWSIGLLALSFDPLHRFLWNFRQNSNLLFLVIKTWKKKWKNPRWRPIWPIYQFSLYLFTPLTDFYQNFTKIQVIYLVLDTQVWGEIHKMAANRPIYQFSLYLFTPLTDFYQNFTKIQVIYLVLDTQVWSEIQKIQKTRWWPKKSRWRPYGSTFC